MAQWLVENVGLDGFRFDFVKGYGPWMVKALVELRCLRSGKALRPFAVGECWDSDRRISEWLAKVNAFLDNPISAFDFPLRDRLKSLCDRYGFSLCALAQSGTILHDRPTTAVTFVENHDTACREANPIIDDKMPAYAFILTHEGYPCVSWRDYFNWGLGLEGTSNGIAALVKTHDKYAGGSTSVLYFDDNLYIMQRNGFGGKPGLVFVLNNWGDDWKGAPVQTRARAMKVDPRRNGPEQMAAQTSGLLREDTRSMPRRFDLWQHLFCFLRTKEASK